jgi:ADP-ribose pyrophosphatase
MGKTNKNDPSDENILLPDTVIQSESIYQGKVVSLTLDTVRMANGRVVTREKVGHPGAVAVVPVDAEGNIILIRQYRHPAEKVLWEIPAGKLEPGEEPQECATRELAEETGYRPQRLDKITQFFTAPGFASEIIHLFFAENLEPAFALQDDDEAIAVRPTSFSECINMVADGRIEDAKTIIGILMMDAKKRKNG